MSFYEDIYLRTVCSSHVTYAFQSESTLRNCLKLPVCTELDRYSLDRDRFIVYVKTEDIYTDIVKDIEKFYTSNFELDKPLAKGKNETVVGLMKDEIGEKSWKDLLD